MNIIYMCACCGSSSRLPGPPLPASHDCPRCAARVSLKAPDSVTPGRIVTTCAVCGDDKLYTQKAFNQQVGCLIVAAGAALVPWTYGLSLAACALIDFLLYQRLPLITVCYVCATRFSGLPINPDHHPFELMTAQTWEARSLNWRRQVQESREQPD